MSKKENITETPQQENKIVTRYDRRMQKRREQEEKDKKEKKITRIVSTVILAAVVCLLVSFPIRNFIAVNQTFVEVDGEKINRVEFDYYYNMALNNYYTQNGMYLSYMGVDLTGDLTTQWYSDTMTWDHYIEMLAVENIKQNKALAEEAQAKGFEYDTEAEWKAYKEMVKKEAASAAVPVSTYVKASFGSYATMNRLKDAMCRTMLANEYSTELTKEMAPAEADIQAYYDEHKDDYDSVDFRLTQIDAELPTEPTELADKKEEKKTEEKKDAASSSSAAEEEKYEPSEAEIEAAMAEAKKKAEEALKTVAKDGELKEDYSKILINSNYKEWMFDPARKAGDTTIAEDTTNHRYYVVAFEKRYLPEEPTVNARILMTEENPQPIYDEWKAGAANEESFIEIFNKYSEDTISTDGGLYEGLAAYTMTSDMSEWLFAEGRAAGDAVALATDSGTNYVIYYVGAGDDQWKIDVKNILLGEKVTEYMTALTEDMEVKDSKGNLEYIAILEAEKAAAESSAAASSSAQ